MKNWFSRNLTNIISLAFVIPILLVAFVSISHVTSFYGLSNPFTWAIFQDWISMVGGLFENMGIEKTDLNSHKTVLAFLTGGLLPIISLTFAHMLVKFTEKNKEVVEDIKTELTEEDVQKIFEEQIKEKEKEKWTPTSEELDKLEEIIKNNYPVEQKPKSNPYQPSEEDLRKIEEVLNAYTEIVNENINNNQIITKDVVEEPIEEIKPITEESQYDNTVYMGLLDKEIDIQPEEVEKKNNELSEQGEVYKVLNYTKRDA